MEDGGGVTIILIFITSEKLGEIPPPTLRKNVLPFKKISQANITSRCGIQLGNLHVFERAVSGGFFHFRLRFQTKYRK